MKGAKGRVTYCTGKDTTGETKEWAKRFNAKYKAQGLSVEILEFPASADAQRQQFVQRQEAKAADCDVFRSDVIWTAEFASQGWLYDLTPYVARIRDRFLAPLQTATYEGRKWGVPSYTNAALLYYRTDKVDRAPPTWQDVYQQAAGQGGIVFQGAAYEGLTCDWLELAFAAGGSVLSADGSKATIDSPQNVAATKLMADAVKSGAAPKAVSTYMEPESLSAWQTGKHAFMRNWPYAYGHQPGHGEAQGQVRRRAAARVRRRGQGEHPRRRQQRHLGLLEEPGRRARRRRLPRLAGLADDADGRVSQMSPMKATYDAPAVKKAIPFSAELRQAIEQARGAAGVAGVSADLAGDLPQRQRRARRAPVARGRDEARAGRHRAGARDLLS